MKALNTYFIIIISIVLFSGTITVKAEKTDSKKIEKRIDSVYKNTNDSVFAFSTVFDAIKQSQEIGFKAGEVSAMHLLGYLFIEYGYLDSAKKYLILSHELTKGINNDKVIAQNYRLLAIYYESTDNFDKALDLLFRSLIIRKRIKDEKGEYATYISIGVIYQRLNLDSKAIIYYNKALKYFERVKNEAAVTSIYSNLGAIYNGIGKIDSAIIYLEKVIEFKSKIGDKISLAKAYHNIGTSYSYLGKYTKAISYFNKAIELKAGSDNNFNIANDYTMLGRCYLKLKNYAEAEKYLLIGEKNLKANNGLTSLTETYQFLADLYEEKKDFTKYVYYTASLNRLNDSLELVRNKSYISEFETKFKTLEKEQENELLKAQNQLLESESKNNTLLAISLLVVLFISIYLAFNLKLVRKTKNKLINKNKIIELKNQEVANQNKNLAQLIEENQSLMGILAHDLRSPFNKISGLTHLLEEEKDENEKAIFINYINTICKDSLQLIQDTIDISEIFNDKHTVTSVKFEKFSPSDVLDNLMNSFRVIAKEKLIDIEVINAIERLEITNSKDYLTRILDNLLSNAVKFSPIKSQVIFTATLLNNNLVFSIKDNGPGFTELDKQQLFMRFKKLSARPTANEASSGLGLFIVKQLTNLMHGDIQVISEFGRGSEFVLTIPVKLPNNA
jgi:signal transduction histidine kinase/Tfp pilus assembly protein PilF